MSTKMSEKTICFDLDATLADYKGWDINGDFPGKPIKDTVDAIKVLKDKGYFIGILTTRPTSIVETWVKMHGLNDLIDFINDNNPHQPSNTNNGKPLAFCYVDDRGVRFDGKNMKEILNNILSGNLKPWYKAE